MAHVHRVSTAPDLVERLAIAAALACLAHCAALPLVIAALPALATVMPVPETVHLAALALAVPTTLFALVSGYRLHGRALPVVAGVAGLALLALGAIAWGRTAAEAPVTIVGSLVIAAAHIGNWRWRRRA